MPLQVGNRTGMSIYHLGLILTGSQNHYRNVLGMDVLKKMLDDSPAPAIGGKPEG